MIKADGKPDKVTVKVTAGSKPVKGVKVVVKGKRAFEDGPEEQRQGRGGAQDQPEQAGPDHGHVARDQPEALRPEADRGRRGLPPAAHGLAGEEARRRKGRLRPPLPLLVWQFQAGRGLQAFPPLWRIGWLSCATCSSSSHWHSRLCSRSTSSRPWRPAPQSCLDREGAVAKREPATVKVSFVRNGRLVRVERIVPRNVTRATHALRELLQGPTRLERAQGLRSAFRPGVRLRSVRAHDDLWLARLSLAPRPCDHRDHGDAARADLRDPRTPWSGALGRDLSRGKTCDDAPIGVRPSPWRATPGEKGYAYTVRGVQLRLWTLGFLDRASVTGRIDYATEQALLAFQGWNDLGRTGTVTGETQLALFAASPAKPTTHRPGRRIEIFRDRGVLLLVEGNEVRRAVHTPPARSVGRLRERTRLSQGVPLLVSAVQRLDAVCVVLCRRHRDARVSRRPGVPGLARVCPVARRRGRARVRVRAGRHSGSGLLTER